ncbi:hypothetical protein [uncultured Gammaproteobacteria bacterium]|nr:hypothetical protein [uncultured Gammaproteobacteria bacterium]
MLYNQEIVEFIHIDKDLTLMKRLIDLTNEEAKEHFLKASSYFNADLPNYISFEPILKNVAQVLKGKTYTGFQGSKPDYCTGVNYSLISNKDGRLAWRPLELIHPVIYVSLINVICESDNWKLITDRLSSFEGGSVECCSAPVSSDNDQTDTAIQVMNWWQKVEQQSITYSLEYNHILHTDVTDCYGALYTHSISWALHGLEEAKKDKKSNSQLGNKIDSHIRASRYGQTNGIPQGSVLMDFIAEIVLGYVDELINKELKEEESNFKILRYRDDYRIFANSDERAEFVLKVVSDKLRTVGMKLGVAKTFSSRNVIEGSIKPDKLAGIELQDLGKDNAKTTQKQLLRLHSFGQRFPNSGALRRLVSEFHTRLVSEFHTNILKQTERPDDLEVQVAIATDIAFVSPATFPAVAGILSHLISLSPSEEKKNLWIKVRNKMSQIPYNGYLEIWLQRITKPIDIESSSKEKEPICQIVNGKNPIPILWKSDWIANKKLTTALDVTKIITNSVEDINEVVQPEEVALFKKNAWSY